MAKDIDVLLPELRAYAAAHRVSEAQLREWATDGASFPSTYRTTHGVANDSTYRKLLQFFLTRRIAGASFAQANAATAAAVDASAVVFQTSDIEAGHQIEKG